MDSYSQLVPGILEIASFHSKLFAHRSCVVTQVHRGHRCQSKLKSSVRSGVGFRVVACGSSVSHRRSERSICLWWPERLGCNESRKCAKFLTFSSQPLGNSTVRQMVDSNDADDVILQFRHSAAPLDAYTELHLSVKPLHSQYCVG